MKKTLNLFLVLTLLLMPFLMAATPEAKDSPVKRFTVVNKSGDTIKWQLTRVDNLEGDTWYYQEVPEGTREFPTERKYTVDRGWYTLTVMFYDVTYSENEGEEGVDPTYTLVCELDYTREQLAEPYIDLTRNQKITILPCDSPPPQDLGEPGMAKFWFPAYRIDADIKPVPRYYIPYYLY